MAGMFQHICRCGTTRLRVQVPDTRAGTRIICYCADCQTAARLHADGADMLSPAGGSEIWQTTPDLIEITAGEDHLRVIRLSPRGLFRWHVACCGTPMLNTLPNLRLPFAGIVLRQGELADVTPVIGALRCHAGTQSAIPGMGAPAKDKGFGRAGFQVLQRMICTLISGRARRSVLRRPDGGPIAPVEVIPKETRLAARPAHLR